MVVGSKNYHSFSAAPTFQIDGVCLWNTVQNKKRQCGNWCFVKNSQCIGVVFGYLSDTIRSSYALDPLLQACIQDLGKLKPSCSIIDGFVRKNGKLVVGPYQDLRAIILSWVYNSPTGGHAGRDATIKKLQQLFSWKGLVKDVQRHVRNCTTCQACKYEPMASPGFFSPCLFL